MCLAFGCPRFPASLASKDSYNLGHRSLFPECSLELNCLIFFMVAQRTAHQGCCSFTRKYICSLCMGHYPNFQKQLPRTRKEKGKAMNDMAFIKEKVLLSSSVIRNSHESTFNLEGKWLK